jgi:signal transduction histidine kinase
VASSRTARRVQPDTPTAVRRIAARLSPGGEPRQALDGALVELIRVTGAKRLVFVARDQWGGRIYRASAAPRSTVPSTIDAALDAADEPTYFFTIAYDVAAVERRGARAPLASRQLDEHDRVRRAPIALPRLFAAAHRFRSLLVMTAHGTDRASYRLFLFDGVTAPPALRLLRAIARQIGPALFSVEALARLQSRVGAAERARVARDLHDGVIQSLIGLEMKVDVWRRTTARGDEVGRLVDIQNALRQEVVALRDLIQHMRRSPVDPERVLEQLAAMVERFRRDTGIDAHFVSEVAELSLSPRACDELIGIVREALVNVRKHSGARHVVVRVSAPDGYWKFEVDDDGRGFEFSGRLEQADLDVTRKGPVVIKERARSIGARLAIHSDPGRGARVEVWLPQPSLPRRGDVPGGR